MLFGAKHTVIMEAPVALVLSPVSLTCLAGRTVLVSFYSERLWMMLASKKPSHLLSLMFHDNETCPDPPCPASVRPETGILTTKHTGPVTTTLLAAEEVLS